MTLFSERKRQRELREREAAGESFWTPELTRRTRARVIHLIADVIRDDDVRYRQRFDLTEHARQQVLKVEGKFSLDGRNDAHEDFFRALEATGDDDLALTLIEAFIEALGTGLYDERYRSQFVQAVNEVFRSERVSYEIIEGEVVPFASREMHVAVVRPTLSLLAGRKGWSEVESAYQDALREIGEDHPADAITDAGRALQIALTLLGAEGNALGPLIKSAKAKGLFAPHDTKLLDGIESLMHWVSADRSETGEAHASGTSARDDAWLAVHVVGALLLRLSAGGRT